MKLKPYKFMAKYKKREGNDTWKEFEKYLYLEPAEVTLAQSGLNNRLKFLSQQVEKGQLPDGYYDEIQLLAWKEKKRWKSKIKKKNKS